jgi:hypothetical protein
MFGPVHIDRGVLGDAPGKRPLRRYLAAVNK